MTTPNDIIAQALRKAGITGIGQTATAEDTNDALQDLNDMLAQWKIKRWLVYHLQTYSIVCTGAQSYTIGPSANINVATRPDRIESAFFRQLTQSQPNQIDYPLRILQSREDYNRIALKQLVTFPQYLFYDSAFPQGVLYPWPVPQADIYSLHVSIKAGLVRFASLTEEIVLPAEYFAALKWNLAQRLRASYQLPVDLEVKALAVDSLNVLRGANTQIAALQIPSELNRNGLYNIFSDQVY